MCDTQSLDHQSGTLNALTDLSAHVIDVLREKEGGQRAPLFDTIRGMHPSPLFTIHQNVLIILIHMLDHAEQSRWHSTTMQM